MKISAALFAVVGVSSLLAACASHQGQAQKNITGSYQLVSLNNQPILNTLSPTLNITESNDVSNIQINGRMCNLFNGQAIYQNGVLQAADGVAMTRAYCGEAVLNQLDTLISGMLAKGAKVEKIDDKLILKTDNTVLIYQQK